MVPRTTLDLSLLPYNGVAMRPWTSFPRPLLYFLAVVFCLVTSLYALLWMYDARQSTTYPVEIGFNPSRDTSFDPSSTLTSFVVYSLTGLFMICVSSNTDSYLGISASYIIHSAASLAACLPPC